MISAFVPMLALPCGTRLATWVIRGSCARIWFRVTGNATWTTKQTPMAIAQMEHLGLADAFDVIAGATPDPGSSKTTVIHEAVARLGAMGADVSHPVIVGDSIWDVRGGHEAGIPVIGVGWGYATEDGLDDAEVVCETVEDLRALLMPTGY